MEKEKIEIKQQMSLEELVIYLEDMTESLKQGRLVIEQGEEYVTLEPERAVDVKVKAKHKEDKVKVKVEFSWSTGEEKEEEAELEITSELPEEEKA
ncbi:MAG: amphi-Trp domain-containing protein [Desulfovibrionales bacterium]